MKEFQIGDRVKCWYGERWIAGTVVRIGPEPRTTKNYLFKMYVDKEQVHVISESDKEVTYLDPASRVVFKYVLTDERVGEESDLFGGFGLRSRAEDHIYTLFEGEEEPPEPNGFVPATDEELESLPF